MSKKCKKCGLKILSEWKGICFHCLDKRRAICPKCGCIEYKAIVDADGCERELFNLKREVAAFEEVGRDCRLGMFEGAISSYLVGCVLLYFWFPYFFVFVGWSIGSFVGSALIFTLVVIRQRKLKREVMKIYPGAESLIKKYL